MYVHHTKIRGAISVSPPVFYSALPEPYMSLKYFKFSLARPYTRTNFPCNPCPKAGMTIALEQPNKTPWQEKIVNKFLPYTRANKTSQGKRVRLYMAMGLKSKP